MVTLYPLKQTPQSLFFVSFQSCWQCCSTSTCTRFFLCFHAQTSVFYMQEWANSANWQQQTQQQRTAKARGFLLVWATTLATGDHPVESRHMLQCLALLIHDIEFLHDVCSTKKTFFCHSFEVKMPSTSDKSATAASMLFSLTIDWLWDQWKIKTEPRRSG